MQGSIGFFLLMSLHSRPIEGGGGNSVQISYLLVLLSDDGPFVASPFRWKLDGQVCV